jgi:hypothetical protein
MNYKIIVPYIGSLEVCVSWWRASVLLVLLGLIAKAPKFALYMDETYEAMRESDHPRHSHDEADEPHKFGNEPVHLAFLAGLIRRLRPKRCVWFLVLRHLSANRKERNRAVNYWKLSTNIMGLSRKPTSACQVKTVQIPESWVLCRWSGHAFLVNPRMAVMWNALTVIWLHLLIEAAYVDITTSGRIRRSGPEPKLSDVEVMTIEILGLPSINFPDLP